MTRNSNKSSSADEIYERDVMYHLVLDLHKIYIRFILDLLRFTLAAYSSANSVQAEYQCLQVSSWGSSILPDESVCSSRYQYKSSLSSLSNTLLVPMTRKVTYGPRSFAVSGPTVWNTLPSTLHASTTTLGQFQSGLKTTLFCLAYGT